MKRYLWILSFVLLISSCGQAATSTPNPAEPIVNFPTVAPETLPACTSSDLNESSNSNQTADSTIIGITLTNKTKSACALSNPPVVKILDESGIELPVQISNEAALMKNTPAALIGLSPSDNIILTMNWQNYCLQNPVKNLTILIELGKDKSLSATVKIAGPPTCKSSKDPSLLKITPYSYPP